MTGRWKLLFVILAAVGLASASSQLLARILHISPASATWEHFGSGKSEGVVSPLGSSLLFYGLNWSQITEAVDRPAERWCIHHASPCELDATIGSVTNVRLTVVGISLYDLNEHFIGGHRAAVVPIGTAVRDLWVSGSDWDFSKRVVAEYPLAYLRRIFPTAGRSEVVMVNLRDMVKRFAGRTGGEDRITFDPTRVTFQRVSDWEQGRVLRNLASLRASCRGQFGFAGPKREALGRLLRETARRGPVKVVVIPVSPAFEREFITSRTRQEFERMVEELTSAVPAAQWIRLDRLPALQSDRYFWDLIHLNVEGQAIATGHFLGAIGAPAKNQ